MTARPPRALVAALALVAGAALGAAQEFPPPPHSGWEAGWHVVRPGDTLEGLARRLLGASAQWRELHRLNPGIADPDRLVPGQRIRIWVERPAPQPNAQVEAVAGRVEERPAPVPWRPAAEGDLLLERDGVRTWARGSSRLRFDDGGTVTLTENSLVFLRRQAPATAPVARQEIEIRVGQADLETTSRPGAAPAIDVVLGAARGRAGGSPEGGFAARTGAAEGGAARLMIYRGQGELAAAGERVALPAGTGSLAEPARPPRPAEALLPAPAPLDPGPDGELGLDDPWLAWGAVAGAASYTLEVCADPGCGQLIERAAGLAETRYRLTAAPAQPAFWRVTAIAASGLDGYPSPARRLVPVASVPPPAPGLRLRGAGGGDLAPGACSAVVPAVEAGATDRRGRPLPWTLAVDGREVAVADAFPASGPYRVAALVRDARGHAIASPERAFVLDLTAPWADPPAAAGPSGAPRAAARPGAAAPCPLGLEYALGDGPWSALTCAPDGAGASATAALAGEHAVLRVRAARAVRLGGVPLAAGEPLAFALGDLGCGLAEVRLELRRAGAGDAGLALEVTDRAGRRGGGSWTLARR